MQVYVEIPPSPLLKNLNIADPPEFSTLRSPLSPLTDKFTASANKKRKSFDVVETTNKKAKPLTHETAPDSASRKVADPTSNACPGYPNGFVYCHQCRQRRDVFACIQCTLTLPNKNQRRCSHHLCRTCLKNRYQEDIDKIKSQATLAANFQCPKCRGICNCYACKKATASKANKEPSRHAQSTTLTKSLQPKKVQPQKRTSDVTQRKKPKKQTLPDVKWRPLPIYISREEAETRIQIREFILRFLYSMDGTIAKTHLDELGYLAGKSRNTDDNEYVPWISEPCVKSIITGILGFFVSQSEGSKKQAFQTAVAAIRSSGSNLSKIWTALAALRDDIQDESFFPNPSPAPESAVAHATRTRSSTGGSEDHPVVVVSAQLVPVVSALTAAALETEVIRVEIDDGMRESKEFAREVKEAIKAENDRWEKERQQMSGAKLKAKREVHKTRIRDLDAIQSVVLPAFAQRMSPLGHDTEGRIYWALGPGIQEREVNMKFVSSLKSESWERAEAKCRIRGKGKGAQEQTTMDWRWFVAVWGKRPEHVRGDEGHSTDSEATDEEEDEETWYIFDQPAQIQSLAQWIAIKEGLVSEDVEDSASEEKEHSAELRGLVDGLKEYGASLQWRLGGFEGQTA